MTALVAAAAAAVQTIASSAILRGLAGLAVSSLLSSAIGLKKKPETSTFTTEARDRTQVIRSSIANRYVVYGETVMSGPLVFAASTGNKNQYLHLVIALAGHECEAIGSVYLGDDEIEDYRLDGSGNVTTGKYTGVVRIKKHLGAVSQSADSDLVAEVTEWTTNHKLSNIAYIYLRLEYNADKFPNGIPNIKAVVKGKKVCDPRTTTTAWSDNWALCMRDFLASHIGADAEELDDSSIIAAANICDEVVATPTGTQSRYTCNGAFDTGTTPAEIREELETAGAGACIYTQGKYHVYAGAYRTPIAQTFNEDGLRGDIIVHPRIARKELFNAVRGVYLSASNFWQPTDFPAVTNASYVAQDNGEEIYRDLQLSFANDSYMAQRIAKIHLEKSRQGISVKFPASLKALQVAPFDTIKLSIDDLGWNEKEFRVVGWEISPDGGIDLDLHEESSSCYDWNGGDATTVDDAPDTNLPDPFAVGVVTGLSFDEDVYDLYGVAILNWNAPNDAFVADYKVEYKRAADSEYTAVPKTYETTTKIHNLAASDYNFRVASINSLGIASTWEYVDGTISVAPVFSRVSGLELFGLANATEFPGQDAKFTWRHSSEYYSSEIGAEEYGADSGGLDNYFRDYEIRIFDESGNHLRTEHVVDNVYTYSYEKNAEDGGPFRTFKIEVYQRGRQGQLSAKPASLTVTNPAPAAPSGLAIKSGYRSLIIEFTLPADTDFSGTLIWLSTETEFTPDETTLVYIGTGVGGFVADLNPDTEYFLRVAAYDRFGITDLNLSSEVSASTTIVGTDDIQDSAVVNQKIGNIIKSLNFVAGEAGWQIDKEGNIELNDAIFRGTINVKSSETGARLEIGNSVIKVYDSNGDIVGKFGDLS